MNALARAALFAAASLACGAASAQTFKCTDKNGKVTYTNVKCGDLGLKEAGEVPDRINVNPAYQPTEQAETQPRISPPPAPAEAQKPAPAAAAPKSGADIDKRRCFKTAQGFRCNDDDSKPDPK
jgi:uncharacterized protein DUF4124